MLYYFFCLFNCFPFLRLEEPHSLLLPTVSSSCFDAAHLSRQNAHQHSTVQYSTVQYSTVQYSTLQYSTVLYSKFSSAALYCHSSATYILTWLTALKVNQLDRKVYCCYSYTAGQTVCIEVKNILKFIETSHHWNRAK